MEYSNMIQFISTRWLCLELCVNREINSYPALKSYFRSETFRDKRFKRLHDAYEDPMTEVYLLSYQSSLSAFIDFNKFLQREEPLFYKLYDTQQKFMELLASKFSKPNILLEVKKNVSISKLDTPQARYTPS